MNYIFFRIRLLKIKQNIIIYLCFILLQHKMDGIPKSRLKIWCVALLRHHSWRLEPSKYLPDILCSSRNYSYYFPTLLRCNHNWYNAVWGDLYVQFSSTTNLIISYFMHLNILCFVLSSSQISITSTTKEFCSLLYNVEIVIQALISWKRLGDIRAYLPKFSWYLGLMYSLLRTWSHFCCQANTVLSPSSRLSLLPFP